jgi:hypothetical protein
VTVAVVDGNDVTTPVVVVVVVAVVVAVVVLAVGVCTLLVDDAVGGVCVCVCGVLVVVVAVVVVAVVVVVVAVVVVVLVVVVVVQSHVGDLPVHRPTHVVPTMQFSPDALNCATQVPLASHVASVSQGSMRAVGVHAVPERTNRSTQRPLPHT